MTRNECNKKSSKIKIIKMKLDALENEIDKLFEYMKTYNKGMENSVYHFIDDLYESLERMSEYSDLKIILEHMRREISSELRYIKFDDNSIPNSFFSRNVCPIQN